MKTGFVSVAFGAAALVSSGSRAESATTLAVPIEITTQSIQAAIERAVPASVERLGAWEFHGDTGVRYGAWRSPVSVVTTGNGIRVAARVEYVFRACRRMNRPRWLGGAFCLQVVQCGFGGDVRPQIDVSIEVSGSWSPNWAFVPAVTVHTRVITPCRLTRANIDVSGRATGLLQNQLEAEARKIEQMLYFRSRAEQAWRGVAARAIADRLWLSWQLDRVSVDRPLWSPGRVSTTVTLAATPALVRGLTAPAAGPLPTELTIGSLASPASPTWRLGADLSWNDVTAVLKSAFCTYAEGRGVEASLRAVSGSAEGRVRADFELEDSPLPALSVSARLHYDTESDTASLEQLRLETDPAPLGSALIPAALLAAAQNRMRWHLQPLIQPAITDARAKLAAAGVESAPADPPTRIERLLAGRSGLSMVVVVPGKLQVRMAPAF